MRTKKLLFFLLAMTVFIFTGCTSKSEPSNAIVTINDEKIETVKGTYRWETKGLFSTTAVVADAASPVQIAEDMKASIVQKKSVANIEFSDGSHPELHAYLWGREKRREALPLKGTQITLPSQAGKQVVEVEAKWPNGEASYTFVVDVDANEQNVMESIGNENLALDVREAVWNQLTENDKKHIKGNWKDASVRKIVLRETMGMIKDKSYVGKQVYMVDYPSNDNPTLGGVVVYGVPGMGDNLVVKVHYRLGSRNC